MCSVKHYGKIIISEIHLPQHVKTIKPASTHAPLPLALWRVVIEVKRHLAHHIVVGTR
jgi:hypothetical protein